MPTPPSARSRRPGRHDRAVRPARPAWLLPALLLAWAALSFALPLLAPGRLSPTLAYGVTALGGPLGFLAIVAVFARVTNRR